MKFTKFTGSLMTSVAVLGSLAFVAPTVANAATQEGNATANGGQELPQTGHTKAGISFGQANPTGNTGYLRLQMVPQILDFGNHTNFDSNHVNFNANGQNVANSANDRFAGYKEGANQTATLNTDNKDLSDVNGKAWATVVDKQDSRAANTDPNTANPGSWQLDVKADGPLAFIDDSGKATSKTSDATINFMNTAYGQTGNTVGQVSDLTGESQDDGYETAAALKPVSKVTPAQVAVADGSANSTVAVAADGEGAGANVFGWNKSDIILTLPSTFAANNGTYETGLTWTLSTGIK